MFVTTGVGASLLGEGGDGTDGGTDDEAAVLLSPIFTKVELNSDDFSDGMSHFWNRLSSCDFTTNATISKRTSFSPWSLDEPKMYGYNVLAHDNVYRTVRFVPVILALICSTISPNVWGKLALQTIRSRNFVKISFRSGSKLEAKIKTSNVMTL